MTIHKIQKTSSYFSRFQVKFRRRREGKTNYKQRKTMCFQDKNKYNTPKYRLVVRFSRKDIVAQVVYASIVGDVVVSSAYAHELPKYGLNVGLTNYSAAYCVGLLIARRTLQKYKLDKAYTGVDEVTGEEYCVEPNDEGPRPFYCILDVGLARTTTGARIFAALKGALDGGLEVPASEKRLIGYDRDEKSMNHEVLKKYIFGGHVKEYMEYMKEEEPEKYDSHFSRFIKAKVDGDALEGIYKKVHANIRKNPAHPKKERKKPAGAKDHYHERKWTKEAKTKALKARIAAMEADE